MCVSSFSGNYACKFYSFKIFTVVKKEQRNYSAAIVWHFILVVTIKDMAVVNVFADNFFCCLCESPMSVGLCAFCLLLMSTKGFLVSEYWKRVWFN